MDVILGQRIPPDVVDFIALYKNSHSPTRSGLSVPPNYVTSAIGDVYFIAYCRIEPLVGLPTFKNSRLLNARPIRMKYGPH